MHNRYDWADMVICFELFDTTNQWGIDRLESVLENKIIF